MADISIDTEVTLQAASSFDQVASMIEQQVTQVRNQQQNVLVEGKGQWTNTFAADADALTTELQRILAMAQEVGRDLRATANGFLEGDMTAAGYFGK